MPKSNQNAPVDDIVQQVLKEINSQQISTVVSPVPVAHVVPKSAVTPTAPVAPRSISDHPCCLFDSLDDATEAARLAQRRLLDMSLEKRIQIINNIRIHALANAERLGQMAVTETGLGKMPDKMNKIILQANKTPGPDDLRPQAWSGDNGLTLVEPAPWGVVGVITPSTNPPSTVLNNSISIVSAGNAAVFNPHPSAKNVSADC